MRFAFVGAESNSASGLCEICDAALIALALGFGVEPISNGGIMSTVPLSPRGRAVPLRCGANGGGRPRMGLSVVMVGGVLSCREQTEVAGLIVGSVVIAVVDVVAFWRLTSIGAGPDNDVQALAVALKILSAEIVSPPLKLLDR